MADKTEGTKELLERRQRRSKLADDLLEDSVEDSDGESGDDVDDVVDDDDVMPTLVTDDADGDGVAAAALTRVGTRSPIEMEDWGEAPDKLRRGRA